MTKPKPVNDLVDQITTAVAEPTGDTPADGEAAGVSEYLGNLVGSRSNATPMNELYRQAVESIRGTDDDAALECLRQLDESQPRKVLPYLRLLLAEHERLKPVIERGAGADEERQSLEIAIAALRRAQPSAAEAEDHGKAVLDFERRYHVAFREATSAKHAVVQQMAIVRLCPRLFSEDPGSQNCTAGGLTPASLRNWLTESGLELAFRDGWVFSALIKPVARRRFTLTTRQ